MPNSWVLDEDKWNKAKTLAKKQGKDKDYAYIVGIYKHMGGKVKKSHSIRDDIYKSLSVSSDMGLVKAMIKDNPDMVEEVVNSLASDDVKYKNKPSVLKPNSYTNKIAQKPMPKVNMDDVLVPVVIEICNNNAISCDKIKDTKKIISAIQLMRFQGVTELNCDDFDIIHNIIEPSVLTEFLE